MGVPVIETDGLTKRFGSTLALDQLTLSVEEGEVFGFLGPNGAGKSTTIRLLLGLIHPTAGSASICGIDVGRVEEVHRRLTYVPGEVVLWPYLTGEETLELLGRLGPGVDRDYRAELIDRYGLDPSKVSRAYSKGNRQKVALVAAFATRADLLLLDEPSSGLDPLMVIEFRRCVSEAAERGQTVFLSSHTLSEVALLCHRVGILRTGRLVEVAGIADLQKLHALEMDVTFPGPAPDLADVPGIDAIEPLGTGGLRLRLAGPPGAALRALADANVATIEAHEASLEEIFLDYYGGGE